MTQWIERGSEGSNHLLQSYLFSREALPNAIERILPKRFFARTKRDLAQTVATGRAVVTTEKKGRRLQRAVTQALLNTDVPPLREDGTAVGPLEYVCELVYLDKLRGRHARPPGRRRVGVWVGGKGDAVNTWQRDERLRQTLLEKIVHEYLPGFDIVAPPRRRPGFQPAPARAGSSDKVRTYAVHVTKSQPPFRHIGGDRYMVFVRRHGTRRPPRSVTIARDTAKILNMQG